MSVMTSDAIRRRAAWAQNPHERAAMEAEADRMDGLEAKPSTLPDYLKNATDRGHGYEMQCPACVRDGMDNKGNHLLVYHGGGLACVRYRLVDGMSYPERDEHLANVRGLLKIPGGKPYTGPDLTAEREAKKVAAIALRNYVFADFAGTLADLGSSGPLPTGQAAFDLALTSYRPGEHVWIGTRYDTPEGKWAEVSSRPRESWMRRPTRFRDNLFDPNDTDARAAAFARCTASRLDHLYGFAWLPGADSRDEKNTSRIVFRVVEHDGTKEAPTPMRHQIAAIRYAKEVLGWKLRYVIDTGSAKPEGGIHGIFDCETIEPGQLAEDSSELEAIGCDSAGLYHAHTRAPGIARAKCSKNYGEKMQSILWVAL